MIGIKGSSDKLYLEETDILLQLQRAAGGKLVGRQVNKISLTRLEKALLKDDWIRDAELYFDRDNVLHVSVDEREPVARIFTTSGASFYMDSSGHKMPLQEKLTARVPVITGYTNARRLSHKDSAVLDDVKELVKFINTNKFWNAQTGQIDITADGKFELIPVVGDHVIRLGNAENLQDKFDRLLLFYKKVLSITGFNKYAAVDVQFANQVVGVYKGATSAVDSLQLEKNIKELLENSTIQNVSEDMLPATTVMKATDSLQQNETSQASPQRSDSKPETNPDPIPEEKTTTSKSQEKPVSIEQHRKPKAVMKKKG